MNKLLLCALLASAAILPATTALAADIDVPPPPPVEDLRPAAYDWTGFNVGVYAGVNALDGSADLVPYCGCAISDLSMSGTGFTFGLKAGADYQMGDLVMGLIADYGWGGKMASNIYNATDSSFIDMNNMATIRGRLGWAADDTLLYLTGGLALANFEVGGTTAAGSDSADEWTKGLAIGAGMEHAITDSVSIGMEYMYVKFQDTKHALDDGTNAGTAIVNYDDFHTIRANLNYRFSL